ncbi:hypothetical protein [Paraburkholderia silvatlantica]|uniref:hypothetical protein n=1 Tax=Paraburkholderia silvatlantica TaxID=321895 RepID=UPI0037514D42
MRSTIRTKPPAARREGRSDFGSWAAALDEKDRALMLEALDALLRERRRAMELSRIVLSERAREAIGFEDFGIGEVLRAARALATRIAGDS